MTRIFAPPPPTHEDVARICRDALGTSPTTITPIRGGAWSSAVALETARGPMIMRFSQIGEDFRTDQLASQFAGPDLPIPAVYGVGQCGEHWWCISQRMPGVHLDDLSASEIEAAIPSLAAMLRAMREAPADGTTGYGGWDAEGNGQFATFADYLLDVARDTPGERGSGWSARLATQPRAQQVFDAALSLMRELTRFVPDTRQLIHRDTLNYNVTVLGETVGGIFDWGCALWGDSLYDLAWFRFCQWWYPQWAALDPPARLEQTVGMEGDHARERMLCYLLHIGLGSISYNAMIENWAVMNDAADATSKVMREWT